MGIEARLASQRLAAGQYGVISRAQALAVGLSPATIRRRVALEEWTVWLPGTYLTGSARPSWRQALMAAALWPVRRRSSLTGLPLPFSGWTGSRPGRWS